MRRKASDLRQKFSLCFLNRSGLSWAEFLLRRRENCLGLVAKELTSHARDRSGDFWRRLDAPRRIIK